MEPWNPFKRVVWIGLESPVTKSEVAKARPILKPIGSRNFYNRKYHAGRIAGLLKTGWNDDIQLDVGIPSLGYIPEWLVIDGNHRLAAAFFRGDKVINCNFSGSINYFMEMFPGVLRLKN